MTERKQEWLKRDVYFKYGVSWEDAREIKQIHPNHNELACYCDQWPHITAINDRTTKSETTTTITNKKQQNHKQEQERQQQQQQQQQTQEQNQDEEEEQPQQTQEQQQQQ